MNKTMKNEMTTKTLLLAVLFCVLLISSCGDTTEKSSLDQSNVTYSPLVWGQMEMEFKGVESLLALRMKRVGDKIYSINQGLWMLEPATGKETLLFKKGMGPNEIYNPSRMHFFENKLYITSSSTAKHVYTFDPFAEERTLERKTFSNAYFFDDITFLSPDLMLTTYAYNKDNFVRVYDFNKQAFVKKVGQPTFHPVMKTFNINWSTVCRLDNRVYIVETTAPQVRVLSLEDYRFLPSIPLSPPFYQPPPKEFIKNAKYNHQAYLKWMSKWSGVIDILGRGDWLLIKYRWGYDFTFAYELLNLKDTSKRYYIERSPKNVYGFEVKGGVIHFELCEEVEDGLVWEKAVIDLPAKGV